MNKDKKNTEKAFFDLIKKLKNGKKILLEISNQNKKFSSINWRFKENYINNKAGIVIDFDDIGNQGPAWITKTKNLFDEYNSILERISEIEKKIKGIKNNYENKTLELQNMKQKYNLFLGKQ